MAHLAAVLESRDLRVLLFVSLMLHKHPTPSIDVTLFALSRILSLSIDRKASAQSHNIGLMHQIDCLGDCSASKWNDGYSR